MRDRAKIAAGVALFVAVALLPVWQRASAGQAARPEPKIAKPGTRCVADRGAMRISHMQVLDAWRDAVVREGARVERAADGRTLTRSLGDTCLGCHENKKEFCDACHADLAVAPVCWRCHTDPKERS